PPRRPGAGGAAGTRHTELEEAARLGLSPPLPPPPPPPPPAVQQTTHTQPPLPPAVFGVKSKLAKKTLTLTVSFNVRRPLLLGLRAFRSNKVVAQTGLKRFQPPSGKLVVRLQRKKWPKRLGFVTDTPTAALHDPRPS